MKTISNTHLTATNKKAIAHLIANNIESGKIGRISYFITKSGGNQYIVNVVLVDRGMGWIGEEKRVSSYTHTVEL